MTTFVSFLPGSSAITLTWGRDSGGSTRMCAVEPACASASPSAKLAPTTGMLSGVWLMPNSVPVTRPSRSGVLPWLKMMTASAPAVWALIALTPNSQVPRWMSAMSLSPDQSIPAKSAASQPLVTGSRGMSSRCRPGSRFP